MHIVVLVKEVLDPSVDPGGLSVDQSGTRLVPPPGGAFIINGYDANGVEAALRLRERLGGKVTAMSLGPGSARAVLRSALAMGADEVTLFEDDSETPAYDPLRTATVLANAIQAAGPVDLVLCGRQASDTDGGQVPQMIAELLGASIVSPVSLIEDDGALSEGQLTVRRMMEDGYQRVAVSFPAVLAVSSETNEPRYPQMMAAAKAKRAFIPGSPITYDGGAPRVELRSLRIPAHTKHAEMLEAEDDAAKGVELADRLHEMGLIR
jgi:electron transfer flavoprotein beta subunit